MSRHIRFLLFATPVLWLLIVCPPIVLISWLLSLNIFKTLSWSILAAPAVTFWIYLSFQTKNIKAKWPATQAIGLCTVLMNVIFFCTPLIFIMKSSTAATIATGLWVLISIYAVWKAHYVQNNQLSLASSKLSSSYRILHLSDLHAGSRSKLFIKKIVQQAIDQQPNIVLITGDLIDSSAVDTAYLKPLSQFTCPVYLCLGNHERYVNLENAIMAIEANNIKILRNEATVNGDLQIIGIDDDDNNKQVANTLPEITRDNSKYQILMYHRPWGFEYAAKAGIDLMLCGHTHAGQMWPFGMLVKHQFPQIKGRYDQHESTLYVSQGTGTWGPTMRLGTSSEMTLINIQPS